MNKIFATLALAGVLALPMVSHAEDSGLYVNGSVGQARFGQSYYSRHHMGYDANLGYRWSVAPAFQVGVEAGYVNLGNYGVRSNYPGIALPNATLHGWTLGGTAKYDIQQLVCQRPCRVVALERPHGGANRRHSGRFQWQWHGLVYWRRIRLQLQQQLEPGLELQLLPRQQEWLSAVGQLDVGLG